MPALLLRQLLEQVHLAHPGPEALLSDVQGQKAGSQEHLCRHHFSSILKGLYTSQWGTPSFHSMMFKHTAYAISPLGKPSNEATLEPFP